MANMLDHLSLVVAGLGYGCCTVVEREPLVQNDANLEQSAGVGTVVSVIASFPQQTENRTFCLVLQS